MRKNICKSYIWYQVASINNEISQCTKEKDLINRQVKGLNTQQERYINGQWARAKMLYLARIQGKENSNHNNVALCNHWTVVIIFFLIRKYEVLIKLRQASTKVQAQSSATWDSTWFKLCAQSSNNALEPKIFFAGPRQTTLQKVHLPTGKQSSPPSCIKPAERTTVSNGGCFSS